jgi:hypothetical protein
LVSFIAACSISNFQTNAFVLTLNNGLGCEQIYNTYNYIV